MAGAIETLEKSPHASGRDRARGTRPPASQDRRTASTDIFGAIRPAKGVTGGLVLPWCNTEAIGLHLSEISTSLTPGKHCALLVDQAGWHTSGRLIVLSDMTIVPLPADGPELTSIDNVW